MHIPHHGAELVIGAENIELVFILLIIIAGPLVFLGVKGLAGGPIPLIWKPEARGKAARLVGILYLVFGILLLGLLIILVQEP